MPSTTRGALPYPAESDVNDVPADLQALADRLALKSMFYVQVDNASHSDRPAPSTAGTLAWCSTHGELWWDDGTAWNQLNPRPVKTVQAGGPPFNVTDDFVDFTFGNWPAAAIVVPKSRMVKVTISADIQNTNTGTSTIFAGWRAAGPVTVSNDGISSWGGRLYGSRASLLTNLTAGTTLTVTPQWRISSFGNSSITFINSGELFLEPIL